MRQLGGPNLPATGFAIGEDRLIEALPASSPCLARPAAPVAVLAAGAVEPMAALELAELLRAAGVAATADLSGRSVRAGLKRADRAGTRFVVLLGDDELAAGQATLRDLGAGDQTTLGRDLLAARIKESS
jgi:histidyl-tRNA synthetase